MAMSFKKSKTRTARMADINVTPMVDVMLVLLVIFMVAAPLMTTGVPVDLPATQAPATADQSDPFILSLTQEGKIFLQDHELSVESLVAQLRSTPGLTPETRIYIRADQSLPYGRIMEIIGLMSAAGYQKVMLVSEITQDKKK